MKLLTDIRQRCWLKNDVIQVEVEEVKNKDIQPTQDESSDRLEDKDGNRLEDEDISWLKTNILTRCCAV